MFGLLVKVLRVVVGGVIVKTGVELARGHYIFSGYADSDPILTGLFIILIGVHIIFISIFR